MTSPVGRFLQIVNTQYGLQIKLAVFRDAVKKSILENAPRKDES